MRVLLPLKKKQDDQEPQYAEDPYADETEFYAVEVTAEGVASDPVEEEEWTDVVPSHENFTATTVLLSAAAARLSCLPPPSSPTSSEESSPIKGSTEPTPFLASAAAHTEFATNESSELRRGSFQEENSTFSYSINAPVEVTFEACEPESKAASPGDGAQDDEEEEGGSGVSTNTPSAVAFAKGTTETALPVGILALTTAPYSGPSCSPSSLGPLSSSTAPTSAGTRARKRRSPPPNTALDLKPPSKKVRDTKPPALDTANHDPSNETPLTTTPETSIMAGGRGGRKFWAGSSPSYYVETNGGREDASSSDEGAELDVRFNYRHESDPSSAREDAPTVASNRNSFYDVCGRDDDDVRERDPILDRPVPAFNDHQFAMALKKRGLEIVEQEGDGNCLFRAISLQVYGDASMHDQVRHRCLDFMARDKEHFSQFITDEPFEIYIRRKRQDGVHGNNPEIQAISELFNRPIEVFVPENGASPLNIFHAEYKTQDAPIRLSYHDGNHYNAVIDPLVPTAGLGLGLPGLQPGLADKMQMAKAVAESDRLADQREYERALEESQNDQLQRAIKESTLSVEHSYQSKALSLSDCDATNFELEQAVLESSLESFRTFEHGRKQASKAINNGRRKRHASPPLKGKIGAVASGSIKSSVASFPREDRQDAGSIPSAASAASASVASAPAVASASASVASAPDFRSSQSTVAGPMMAENYPQTVQELVMNGFDLRKVVHAYELVGDNFDDLLGFLMSNSGGP